MRQTHYNRSIRNSSPVLQWAFCFMVLFSGMLFAQSFAPADKLEGSEITTLSVFGWDIAADGDYAFIGTREGKVYVYKKDSNGDWLEDDILSDGNGVAGGYGHSVAIDGNKAVVSAPHVGGSGKLYFYELIEGVWTEVQSLNSSTNESGARFGQDVSMSGNYVIASAHWEDDERGAVYIFECVEGTWGEVARLAANSNDYSTSQFGLTVGIAGDYAVVANDSPYVYHRSGGNWALHQILVTSDDNAGDPRQVTIEGEEIFIGANTVSDPDNGIQGAAYVFELVGNTWMETKKITNPQDPIPPFYRFGSRVSIGENMLFITANNNQNQIHVYVRDDVEVWKKLQVITGTEAFGTSSDIVGNTLFVGAPGQVYPFIGKTYVFELIEGPAAQIQAIIDAINEKLADENLPPAAANDLNNAISDLETAQDYFESNDYKEGLKVLEEAAEDLMAAADDGADVADCLDALLELAEGLVNEALATAQTYAGSAIVDNYIADGEGYIADAADELADDEPDQALRRYCSAYKELQWAIHLGSAIAQGMDAESDVNTIIADVQDLITNGGFSSSADADLQDAIDELNDAIADFNDGDIYDGMSDLRDAVEELQDAESDGASATAEIDAIVALAKTLAETKVAEAQEFAGNPVTDSRIVAAQVDLADAADEIADGDHDRAVKEYRDAWYDARIGLEHGRGLRKTAGDGNTTAIPATFALEQNYPNPFNPGTTIKFALPAASTVTLKVYNINGQLVNTLVSENLSAGYHSVSWNGKNINGQHAASGLYFYQITAGEFQQVRKMMLIK